MIPSPLPRARMLPALLLAGLTAGPALAVTPDEVWDQTRRYLEGMGYAVEAQLDRTGPDLVIRQVTARMTPADGSGATTLRFGGLTLSPRGGDVAMLLPSEMPLQVTSDTEDGLLELDMTYVNRGTAILASGTADAVSYSYSGGGVDLRMDRLAMPDETPIRDFGLVTLDGLSGRGTISGREMLETDQDITIDRVGFTFDIVNPEEEVDLHAKGSFAQVMGQGRSSQPVGSGAAPGFDSLDEMIDRGLTAESTITHAGGEFRLTGSADGKAIDLEQTSQGGQSTYSLSSAGMHFDIGSVGVALHLTQDELPFPVDVRLGEAGFGLQMPLTAEEAPTPVSLRVTLRDLTLPDGVWGQLDPMDLLAHDPLTLDARLSGTGRLLASLADPEALVTGGSRPGELSSLSIDTLELKAGGASLTAHGAFDIDNDKTSALNPKMPRVTGRLDAEAHGLMGLLKALSEMKLLPSNIALAAPMMAPMFTRQIGGPDDLATTLEIQPDETVTVNGRPLMP